MRRSTNVGVALVGLLVFAAISVAAGSGRKPAEGVDVSVRRLSTSEMMDILQKFPEMVPSYLGDQRNDTGLLKLLYPFKEVTSAPVERVFPGVRFYQGLDRSRSCGAEYPYMLAIAGDKRYGMTNGFNRLLLDNGLEVTDKNIVELAKAFVITAIGSEHYSYPEVTFLDAARTKLDAERTTTDAARLRVKIGAQAEEWHFSVLWNQFDGVSSSNDKGLIKDYLPTMVESLPGRGQ